MEIPVLDGERGRLRPLEGSDLDVLVGAVGDPTIAEWWGDTSDPAHVREGLVNGGTAFAVEADGELAGWLGFDEENEPDYRHAAFDILLLPGFQGRGLGQDALRTAIRWLVDDRGHHRFTIDPTIGNDRAIAAYERVGFKPVGIMRQYVRAPDGHWRDGLLMDLLAEDLDAPTSSA